MSGPKDYDLWVDFNDVRQRQVETPAENARTRAALTVGCVVVVGNDDGTRALAKVESRSGGLITVTLLRSLEPAPATPGATEGER